MSHALVFMIPLIYWQDQGGSRREEWTEIAGKSGQM